MKVISITLTSAAFVSLSACAASQPALPASYNTAVKSNISAQTITPPPAQKADRNIPQNRVLRDAARDRYRTDTVKVPKQTATQ